MHVLSSRVIRASRVLLVVIALPIGGVGLRILDRPAVLLEQRGHLWNERGLAPLALRDLESA